MLTTGERPLQKTAPAAGSAGKGSGSTEQRWSRVHQEQALAGPPLWPAWVAAVTLAMGLAILISMAGGGPLAPPVTTPGAVPPPSSHLPTRSAPLVAVPPSTGGDNGIFRSRPLATSEGITVALPRAVDRQ
jgi:hypothetical protein